MASASVSDPGDPIMNVPGGTYEKSNFRLARVFEKRAPAASEQETPSPVYGLAHAQEKEPGVLRQTAFASQLLKARPHSSISLQVFVPPALSNPAGHGVHIASLEMVPG